MNEPARQPSTSVARGRYAPSPTGEIHLGNASTALVAWLAARSSGGSFVLRMEDLDRPRVKPGAAARILDDLAWLGLDWDEGPDRGGPHAPYEQSRRGAHYDRAFAQLVERGRIYPCFCSRKDVASAASAPQAPGDEVRYPGTCRALSPSDVSERIAQRRPHAWRFRVDAHDQPRFADRVRGPQEGGADAVGDFVVRRADGIAAYQLAVVVDDAAMGIGEVVRGDDLLGSTPRQLLLYEALDQTAPRFAHVPLLLGPDGVRLSKRHQGTSIRELRDARMAPEAVVGRLAHLLGLAKGGAPVAAVTLVEGFAFDKVVHAPAGLAIDPEAWGMRG